MDKIGTENYTKLYKLSIVMKIMKLKFILVVSICCSLYITYSYWPLSTLKFLSSWGKVYHMLIRIMVRKGSFWIWNNVSAAHLSSFVHPRNQTCLFHRRKDQVQIHKVPRSRWNGILSNAVSKRLKQPSDLRIFIASHDAWSGMHIAWFFLSKLLNLNFWLYYF